MPLDVLNLNLTLSIFFFIFMFWQNIFLGDHQIRVYFRALIDRTLPSFYLPTKIEKVMLIILDNNIIGIIIATKYRISSRRRRNLIVDKLVCNANGAANVRWIDIHC